MNPRLLVIAFLRAISCAVCAAQASKQLLSDAELTGALDSVDNLLPRWERAIAPINPEKIPSISYQAGKLIDVNKGTITAALSQIPRMITSLRRHRNTFDELALRDALWTLREGGSSLVEDQNLGDLALMTPLLSVMNDTSPFEERLTFDVMGRIARSEESGCGTAK